MAFDKIRPPASAKAENEISSPFREKGWTILVIQLSHHGKYPKYILGKGAKNGKSGAIGKSSEPGQSSVFAESGESFETGEIGESGKICESGEIG